MTENQKERTSSSELFAIGILLSASACSDGSDGADPAQTGGNSGTEAPTGTGGEATSSGGASTGGRGSSSGGSSSSTGGVANNTFDCNTISDTATYTALNGPIASRGITFDDDGLLVGGGISTLFRSTRDTAMVLVPNITAGRGQIAKVPNGDFLLAADGFGLLRITPDGGNSVFHGSYGFYTVAMGPKDMVYVTDSTTRPPTSRVIRLDPDTADESMVIELDNASSSGSLEEQSRAVRVIDFSPDFDWMYLGTHGSIVWKVPLDENANPSGPPVEFLNLNGENEDFPKCDGSCTFEAIGVDVCGNVYLSNLDLASLIRVSPDGSEVVTLWSPALAPDDVVDGFAHGMSWGPHAGSVFAHDALYLATPYASPGGGGGVAELDIGVPHRTWPGTVMNRAP